jgi:hypothetical protein
MRAFHASERPDVNPFVTGAFHALFIRPETAANHVAIWQVHRLAFGRDDEARPGR